EDTSGTIVGACSLITPVNEETTPVDGILTSPEVPSTAIPAREEDQHIPHLRTRRNLEARSPLRGDIAPALAGPVDITGDGNAAELPGERLAHGFDDVPRVL